MKIKLALAVVATLTLTGCLNIGTPPSQITGAYVSPLKYASNTCEELIVESSSLARRYNILTTAQEQRVSSNTTTAFWMGSGNGDGIEAAELASVIGEREAVRSAMETKVCK
jgi:hypothetical protein